MYLWIKKKFVRLAAAQGYATFDFCYLYEPVKCLKYQDIQTLSSTIPKKL